jgi:hypothetical protein
MTNNNNPQEPQDDLVDPIKLIQQALQVLHEEFSDFDDDDIRALAHNVDFDSEHVETVHGALTILCEVNFERISKVMAKYLDHLKPSDDDAA